MNFVHHKSKRYQNMLRVSGNKRRKLSKNIKKKKKKKQIENDNRITSQIGTNLFNFFKNFVSAITSNLNQKAVT